MVIKKFNRSESAQKILMQVGIDVKYMHTNFGGHGLSGFRDELAMVHKSGKI